MHGHYVRVEKNVKLYVEDVGKGKPVVFIHGWPVNYKMYEYQENILPSKGIRFIGIDLRGYGKSDHPWDGYTYDRMADDIKEVIDQLKLEDVTLAGFSMGGAVSIRYMARHGGHKVSKLMLFGAAAPVFTKRNDFPYGTPKKEVDALIMSTYQDRPKTIEDFGKTFFYQQHSPAFHQWFNQLGIDANPHATIKGLEALRDEDLRADLPKINVPTLILHGANDKVCTFPLAIEMHKGIKNSKLVRFEKSGHGLFYDEKDKFNQEILNFVQ
ncbi:alpha/beta fold hydrolase [Bacillus sp. 03113]|uniref:alpha/beta fold hydrolase n=1 Tax=Bacillus sp. 03113 TaxID=2578211 RepID=UPI0011439B13|nr:alpha/beta hydrolase [Bacillus sp. 03113]